MKSIGVFATADCRKQSTRLSELIGGANVKTAFGKFEYAQQVVAMIRKESFDAIIVTDSNLLKPLLQIVPDFRAPRGKNGVELKLSMNNYHGSFIRLNKEWIGATKDCDLLFLNELSHLVKVPEAPFIFKRFISKITKPDNWFPQTDFTWELINEACTEDTWDRILARFDSAILVAVDIETDRDSPLRTINCVGYCGLFADGSTHSVVIPIRSMTNVMRMRRMNSSPAKKVMQGGTYDAVYFARYGSPLDNWLYDTSNMFHCMYTELPKRLDYLTAYAVRYIRYWKDDASTGGSYEYFQYNARDCWTTLMACCSLLVDKPSWMVENYRQEFPLNFPCIHMELDGLATDKEEFDKSLATTEAKADASLKKLRSWIHPDFNPRSPVQCKNLLWVLGYRDRNGEITSSDEPTLVQAAATHPLIELITTELLEYRGLVKLRDTYLVWNKMWNGRLFYRINANGTDSFRLSSSESSFWCGLQIQNISRGGEVKCWVRSDDGWLLAEGDYSQSEAYCVGYLSGCETLIEILLSPHDYHAWNASRFFGIPYESIYDEATGKTVNKEIRDLSKRVNHGSNYNMTKWMLMLTMGPKKVAEARRVLKLEKLSLLEVCDYLLGRYADTYPEVKKDWYRDIVRTISLTKKLVSALGQTRYFFSDPSKSKTAHDSAVAHGPQNLSASIINQKAMMPIFRRMLFGDFRGKMRLKANIHDSLFYQYKIGEEWVRTAMQQMMSADVEVTDIKGKKRTMSIPVDMSEGATHWSKLK